MIQICIKEKDICGFQISWEYKDIFEAHMPPIIHKLELSSEQMSILNIHCH